MDAVILVGGGGTRLRPLTYAVPKPLIPIFNQPLIARIIANLASHGVNRVVLAASAGDRRLEAALGSGARLGVKLSYSYETEPLGSGLAVKQAARGFDGAFFVCNGDIITDLDLSVMLKRHLDRKATLSISLSSVDDPTAYGIAELAAEDRISRFVEKPARDDTPSSWANAGTWIFEPAVLDLIPDEKMDGSLERLVFPSLIADGFIVQGFPSDAYWIDVGTSERYLQLHRDILAKGIEDWLPPGIATGAAVGDGSQVWPDAELGANVLLGRNARIGAGARIEGPSVLGDNCVVRERATIFGSVLWSDVKIGAGATVRDSIIGAGCWIGDNALVEGSVLANGARVKRSVHLERGSRLEPDEVAG
jgi:mannose-1-phosphate guanylyltransferase